MAISTTHYCILRDMFEHGLLPSGGALLELGEANWYGDVDPASLVDDIRRLESDAARRDALVARLSELIQRKEHFYLFHVAKVVYDLFFSPSLVQSIDFEGTESAMKLDL